MHQRIAIIGGGVMGETILSGLLRAGYADVVVAEKRAEIAEAIGQRHGVAVLSPVDAVRAAHVVFLAVKPQDMGALLDVVGSEVPDGALVVSIAAGITTEFLEQRVSHGVACVRAMPNTPALVAEGMSAVAAGSRCTPEQVGLAAELLECVGRVVTVPEDLMNAVTAVSGSGPAYLFFLVEAMVASGVSLGLAPEVARELAVQTVVGASAMLRITGEEPAVLRQRVTSPKGTTAAAIAVLEEEGVRETVARALTAARDRGRELSGG